MGIEKAQQGILSQSDFESRYGNLMPYKDYLSNALKFGSAFTIAHAATLKSAKDTSDNIKESVDGWYVQKEQKKDEAEEEYYAALEAYQGMKNKNDVALRDLKYATDVYGEESTQYAEAQKKYNISNKSLFGADVGLSIARDKFNFANNSAFKAYLSTQLK